MFRGDLPTLSHPNAHYYCNEFACNLLALWLVQNENEHTQGQDLVEFKTVGFFVFFFFA